MEATEIRGNSPAVLIIPERGTPFPIPAINVADAAVGISDFLFYLGSFKETGQRVAGNKIGIGDELIVSIHAGRNMRSGTLEHFSELERDRLSNAFPEIGQKPFCHIFREYDSPFKPVFPSVPHIVQFRVPEGHIRLSILPDQGAKPRDLPVGRNRGSKIRSIVRMERKDIQIIQAPAREHLPDERRQIPSQIPG